MRNINLRINTISSLLTRSISATNLALPGRSRLGSNAVLWHDVRLFSTSSIVLNQTSSQNNNAGASSNWRGSKAKIGALLAMTGSGVLYYKDEIKDVITEMWKTWKDTEDGQKKLAEKSETITTSFEVLPDTFPSVYVDSQHQKILDGSDKMLVITGVTGSGKSTLAHQCAKIFQKHIGAVTILWIDASTEASLKESYCKILSKLKTHSTAGGKLLQNIELEKLELKDMKGKIQDFLSKIVRHTMVIYDNVPGNLGKGMKESMFLGDSTAKISKIIVTTRDKNFSKDSVDLSKGMPDKDAVSLLRKLAPHNKSLAAVGDEDEILLQLLEYLGRIPNNLRLVGMGLNNDSSLSAKQYLNQLKNYDYLQDINEDDIENSYPVSTKQLVGLAVSQLEKDVREALYLSVLGKNPEGKMAKKLASAGFDAVSLQHDAIKHSIIIRCLIDAKNNPSLMLELTAQLRRVYTKDTQKPEVLARCLHLQHLVRIMCLTVVNEEYQKALFAKISPEEKKKILLDVGYLLDVTGYLYSQNGMGSAPGASEVFRAALDAYLQITDGKDDYKSLHDADASLPMQYAGVLYSYGRRYFYTREERKVCQEQIEKSLKICKQEEATTGVKYLQTILTERNGTLYFDYESQDPHVIKKAIKRYIEMSELTGVYIKPDGTKADLSSEADRHRNVCRSQIIRGIEKLNKLGATYDDIGIQDIEKMIVKMRSGVKGEVREAAFLNTAGMFYLTLKRNNKAVDLFTEALELELKAQRKDYPMAEAAFNLAKLKDADNGSSAAKEYVKIVDELKDKLQPKDRETFENWLKKYPDILLKTRESSQGRAR